MSAIDDSYPVQKDVDDPYPVQYRNKPSGAVRFGLVFNNFGHYTAWLNFVKLSAIKEIKMTKRVIDLHFDGCYIFEDTMAPATIISMDCVEDLQVAEFVSSDCVVIEPNDLVIVKSKEIVKLEENETYLIKQSPALAALGVVVVSTYILEGEQPVLVAVLKNMLRKHTVELQAGKMFAKLEVI